MRNLLLSVTLVAGLVLPVGAIHAQGADTVTATCKDGTDFTGAKRSGACRGHGGVQSWGTPSASSPLPTSPQAGAQPARTTSQPPAANPGGSGQVWVNSSTKVYHCAGTRWYGKTKHGNYTSEAQAKEQGARPDHGKACTS
jgi:hypothetical protein